MSNTTVAAAPAAVVITTVVPSWSDAFGQLFTSTKKLGSATYCATEIVAAATGEVAKAGVVVSAKTVDAACSAVIDNRDDAIESVKEMASEVHDWINGLFN